MDDYSDWGFGSDDYDLSDAYSDSEVGTVGDELWGPDPGYSDPYAGAYSPTNEFGSDVSSDSGSGWMSGAASGAAAGAAFGPWGALIGAGLGAVGSFFQGKADEKKSKEAFERQKELIAFQNAENEKYYQLHGKQLQDAYAGYKQFYKAPGTTPSATAQFGLANPGGPSGYFH
ncbi:MAG TPA: hypothetical protein VHL10_04465 [Nitrososphaera sp.]|nr:hypothetical protein [Nitrososphaera sp.]